MKKLFVILLLSLPAFSQGLGNLSLKHFQGVPTGSCSKNTLGENDLTGFLYSCDVSQSPPQWTTNTVSGICTGVGNCLISGNLFVGPGTPNEGTTGTDLNLTAEFVNVAGVVKLKKCAAAKQYCFTVVRESAGGTVGVTTGNAWVNGAFTETDTFTNTAVVGNWFKATAAGAAGQVDDTGTANTSACPSGSTCLGFAVTGGTGAQTVVRLSPVVGSSAGGANAPSWTWCANCNTGLTALVANTTLVWGLDLGVQVVSTGVCWDVTTADNTGNLYDIGIYNVQSSPTLLAHLGATLGTTFSPSTGIKCAAWTGGSTTFAAGHYMFAYTGNAATAVIGGGTTTANWRSAATATGGGTAGGALNGTLTGDTPTVTWSGSRQTPQLYLTGN